MTPPLPAASDKNCVSKCMEKVRREKPGMPYQQRLAMCLENCGKSRRSKGK